MPVRLIVTMTAAPGKGDELAKAMHPRLAEVREEPGCQQYDLFQDTERTDMLVLLEQWTNEETLAAHSERNRSRGPSASADLRGGPSKMERFTFD